jgi:hypothetical protein
MADVCWVVKEPCGDAYLCPLDQGWSVDRKDALRFACKRQAFGVAGILWDIGCNAAVFRVTKKRGRRG